MSSAVATQNIRVKEPQGSVALRDLIFTYALTLALMGTFGLLWGSNGNRMLVIAMGWPHVVLGFLFYFGKVWRGEPGYRQLGGLLLFLTIVIWAAHYNLDITRLIYLYFFYHAFRDEIFAGLIKRAGAGSVTEARAAGVLATLILVLFLLPQPQAFLRDLRTIEVSGQQVAAGGWTLIRFEPVENSRGREFYFHLHAPHTAGTRAFTTNASNNDTRSDGEVLVNDEKWGQAADLIFLPHYGQATVQPDAVKSEVNQTSVLLTGGHRVGQTFRAEEDHLSGIWLPIQPLEGDGSGVRFIFGLAGTVLPSAMGAIDLRLGLVAILGVLIFWRLVAGWRSGFGRWLPLFGALGVLAVVHAILRKPSPISDSFTDFFQVVVVFHYLSWYVYSFEKLRAPAATLRAQSGGRSLYDRLLNRLRDTRRFAVVVVVLNLLFAVLVLVYYLGERPPSIQYIADYNYFLYILAFHVTFSFKPRVGSRPAPMLPASAGTGAGG